MATGWEAFPLELKGGLISNMSRLQQGIKAPGSAMLISPSIAKETVVPPVVGSVQSDI